MMQGCHVQLLSCMQKRAGQGGVPRGRHILIYAAAKLRVELSRSFLLLLRATLMSMYAVNCGPCPTREVIAVVFHVDMQT